MTYDVKSGIALLEELADSYPVRPESEINVCAFCDHTWPSEDSSEGHHDDCWWVRARAWRDTA